MFQGFPSNKTSKKTKKEKLVQSLLMKAKVKLYEKCLCVAS